MDGPGAQRGGYDDAEEVSPFALAPPFCSSGSLSAASWSSQGQSAAPSWASRPAPPSPPPHPVQMSGAGSISAMSPFALYQQGRGSMTSSGTGTASTAGTSDPGQPLRGGRPEEARAGKAHHSPGRRPSALTAVPEAASEGPQAEAGAAPPLAWPPLQPQPAASAPPPFYGLNAAVLDAALQQHQPQPHPWPQQAALMAQGRGAAAADAPLEAQLEAAAMHALHAGSTLTAAQLLGMHPPPPGLPPPRGAPGGGGAGLTPQQWLGVSPGLAAAAQAAALQALSPRQSFDAPSPPGSLTPRPSSELRPSAGGGAGSASAAAAQPPAPPAAGVPPPAQDASSLFFPTARCSTSLESMRSSHDAANGGAATSRLRGGGARRVGSGGAAAAAAAASALAVLQLAAARHPRLRALVSAGGRFAHAPGGGGGRGVTYEGGDVRLVNLPEGCSLPELLATVAKTERVQPGSGGRAIGASAAAAAAAAAVAAQAAAAPNGGGLPHRFCTLRYQLPSDPTVFVDVVDDEDCALMFEEAAEQRAREGPAARKLHLLVEWLPQRLAHASGGSEELAHACSLLPSGSASSSFDAGSSLGDEGGDCGASGGCGGARAGAHAAHASAADLRVAAVRTDQLEVIPARDVVLHELLGTGTFGDMYRGRWLDCDVGVKCLNPAAIGLHYSSRAAWIEFLEDANRMGALRHPGLVEVYGVVLPGCLDTRGAAEAPRWSGGGGGGGGGAGGADGDGGDPPLLGARRASWDFGAGALPGRGPSASPSSPPPPPVAPPRVQRLPGPVAAPPALVMEYVEGRSLRGAIARRDDAVAGALARVIYALDCARALAYLHAKGAPHLDFKSDNVLVGRRDRRPMAKVVGYGLTSRKAGVAFYSPGVTMSRGVLPWAAPEIVRAPAKLGPKADVYSFGIVMWELWALQAPYPESRYQELVSKLVNTEEELRPQVPGEGGAPPAEEPGPGWGALVGRCWAEDPEERPEMREVVEELRAIARKVWRSQRAPEQGAGPRSGGGGGGAAGRAPARGGCGEAAAPAYQGRI